MSNPIKLYEHQQKIHERSKDSKAFALFMETGTGKTITSIETIKHLWETKKIDFCVIIAPMIVCEAVWEIELGKYYGTFNFRIIKWVGGMSFMDKSTINYVMKTTTSDILPIFIINVESLSHGVSAGRREVHVKSKIFEYLSQALKIKKSIVILDESTTIKSPKALRTKALLSISHLMHYKRILSGYPILRSPEDLFTQILFLNRSLMPFTSFFSFRNHFTIMKPMGKYAISTGIHRNLDALGKIIEPFSARVTKKECLDLPEKVMTKRYIEMTKEQADMYEQMKKSGYVELKNSVDGPMFAMNFLSQISKLHQIANGVLVQRAIELECRKYVALLHILENEIAEQCCIWFWFTNTLKRAERELKAKFGNDSVRTVYGDSGSKDSKVTTVKDFQQKKFKYLLANQASLMQGVTMVNCSDVIYFNNSTNLEHRIQSADRFHRIGQVNKVVYIDLVTKGTVEDKILAQLQKNHKIGAEVLKDEWEEWFK